MPTEPGAPHSIARQDDRYEQSYFAQYAGAGAYTDSRWRRFFRTRLIRRHVTGGRLLEIGCAFGHLLRALEDRFACHGIDVSAHAIAAAKQTTSAHLECGDAETIARGLPAASFDAIAAFDVLEHLPEDRISALLREVARLLRPGGHLFLSVPNTACVSVPLKNERWAGMRDTTHVSLLAPERWLQHVGCRLTVVRTGGDGLWDAPYLPLLPVWLQSVLFGMTQIVAGWTAGLFPRRLSENLIIVAVKPEGAQWA